MQSIVSVDYPSSPYRPVVMDMVAGGPVSHSRFGTASTHPSGCPCGTSKYLPTLVQKSWGPGVPGGFSRR
eukprot:898085-Pyramimonas_sp.AAC.1